MKKKVLILFSSLLLLGCASSLRTNKQALSTITIQNDGGSRIIEMTGVRSIEIIVPAGVEVTVDHY